MSDYIKLGVILFTFTFAIASIVFACYKHTNHITEQENNLKELCLKSDLSNSEIKELCRDVTIHLSELVGKTDKFGSK